VCLTLIHTKLHKNAWVLSIYLFANIRNVTLVLGLRVITGLLPLHKLSPNYVDINCVIHFSFVATSDNHFGFKPQHASDMVVSVVSTQTDCDILCKHGHPVFSAFLNVSKTKWFDRTKQSGQRIDSDWKLSLTFLPRLLRWRDLKHKCPWK